MGTTKHSKASKKQWALLTLEQKRERMRAANEARWKGTKKKDRSEHASMMANALHSKKKKAKRKKKS
jgi:hypothetical protein